MTRGRAYADPTGDSAASNVDRGRATDWDRREEFEQALDSINNKKKPVRAATRTGSTSPRKAMQ